MLFSLYWFPKFTSPFSAVRTLTCFFIDPEATAKTTIGYFLLLKPLCRAFRAKTLKERFCNNVQYDE